MQDKTIYSGLHDEIPYRVCMVADTGKEDKDISTKVNILYKIE